MYVYVSVVTWVSLYLLRATHFPVSEKSDFELQRRTRAGDVIAKEELLKKDVLPRLYALMYVIQMTVLILAVTMTVNAFGFVAGVLLSLALLLVAPYIEKTRLLLSISNKITGIAYQRLVSLTKGWQWLDLISSTESARIPGISSKEELLHLIETDKQALTADERIRAKATLGLESKSVEDIMTPRAVVHTVQMNDELGPLVLDDLHKTGHSRFPVVAEDNDHIVGILYLRQIVNLKKHTERVVDAMDENVYYIHKQQSIEHALHGFLKTHHHLFVVINDYRETVGVVTLEDALEATLGRKIVDEFDKHDDLRAVAASNPRKNNMPARKKDI